MKFVQLFSRSRAKKRASSVAREIDHVELVKSLWRHLTGFQAKDRLEPAMICDLGITDEDALCF